jgi:hypothetical protein
MIEEKCSPLLDLTGFRLEHRDECSDLQLLHVRLTSRALSNVTGAVGFVHDQSRLPYARSIQARAILSSFFAHIAFALSSYGKCLTEWRGFHIVEIRLVGAER